MLKPNELCWLGPVAWVCVRQAQSKLILTLLAYHHVSNPGAEWCCTTTTTDHKQTRNVKIAPAKPLINYHNSNHYRFLPLSGCKNWPDIDSKLNFNNCHITDIIHLRDTILINQNFSIREDLNQRKENTLKKKHLYIIIIYTKGEKPHL